MLSSLAVEGFSDTTLEIQMLCIIFLFYLRDDYERQVTLQAYYLDRLSHRAMSGIASKAQVPRLCRYVVVADSVAMSLLSASSLR